MCLNNGKPKLQITTPIGYILGIDWLYIGYRLVIVWLYGQRLVTPCSLIDALVLLQYTHAQVISKT